MRTDDALTGTLWAAWQDGVLLIQQCADCGGMQHPPGHVCSHCHSADLTWSEASGTGTLVAFSTVHRAPTAEFSALTPYTVAVIRLSEGPLLETWLIDDVSHSGSDGRLDIGAAVTVAFGDINGRNLPLAQPSRT